MKSTLLVSGLDTHFVSSERVFDFASQGAGLLAHSTIQRNLFYLTQLYPEFSQNVISFFANSQYNNFSSVDHFLKKNDHSHFTTGIIDVVVLKRLSSSKTLTAKVYGVDESNSLEFEYLDSLISEAKKLGIQVETQFDAQPYLQ